MLMPEAATAPNITITAPPNTACGTACITPATAGNRPNKMSKAAIQIPT
ncbi:Uncharacterised protein [Acinetobacter baumannii]|nr:Uncharacterised protein [Acinetobacter baumannii]